ncbi:hypothetical protein G3R49_00435 [Shewanella sp. WXL01]|uniref:Uncharacterized protein n=1 Tax=Shewanella maritima TaxID=2520507 RepID=A0A411PGY8_9GAMM|nr:MULTISPECIES: hypothetical protein [Shewanella]NKF49042.1 hypothetical protein [Shewanella sp. WXL01]QBF82815.1 hypothetical protein EXU30_09005 [Shewanella maritima]
MKLATSIKTGLLVALTSAMLVGCGGSSEEEQLTWINEWNHSFDVDMKMKMLNTCFKKAGVKGLMDQMSEKQNDIYNECQLDYMIELAEKDDVSLDRDLLAANILQM